VTVVVALVGRDAIVLASDSQETAGATKSYMQKLFLVGGSMAWGGSGDSGLIQRVSSNQASIIPQLASTPWEVAKSVEAVTNPIQQAAFSNHLAVPGFSIPTFAGLFCWYDQGAKARIYQVYANVASNQFRTTGRAAIGSGQQFAEVAHLDTDRLQMVAWKSVWDVISSSSYGVGLPIRLAVVEPNQSRLLPPDEVDGVRDSVIGWLERQREALGPLAPVVVSDESEPEQETTEIGVDPPAEPTPASDEPCS
jgi:hypothetical protein